MAATASTPVNVHNGSHAGLLATALMAAAIIALLVLTVLGILFYTNYASDQAAKKNGSTINVQAPAGSTVDQGAAGSGTGAGTGSSSRSGSGSAGTGSAGGAGGAGGNAAAPGNDTIRVTVPNVTVPSVPGQ